MVTVIDMCSRDEEEDSWICVRNAEPLVAKLMTDPVQDSAPAYVAPALQQWVHEHTSATVNSLEIVSGCLENMFSE